MGALTLWQLEHSIHAFKHESLARQASKRVYQHISCPVQEIPGVRPPRYFQLRIRLRLGKSTGHRVHHCWLLSQLMLDAETSAIETSKHPLWAWLNQGSQMLLLRTRRLSLRHSSEATRMDANLGTAPVGLRRVCGLCAPLGGMRLIVIGVGYLLLG